MKKIRYIILAVLVFATVSCRKESEEFLSPDNHICRTFTQQFETIWQGLDQGYIFWALETIDWDARHAELLPVFEEFDNSGNVTDAKLQAAYEKLLDGLHDHHMYVKVKNLKNNHQILVYPAREEILSRDYYHNDYQYQQAALLQNMPGVTNYTEGGNYLPSWFAVFPGTDGKKIAYLRFSEYAMVSLMSAVQSGYLPQTEAAPFRAFYGTDPTVGVTNGWAGKDEVEAVIIDVRGNGGGNLIDIRPMIGSLTPTRTDVGYSRVKEGLGRLDYSEWIPFGFNAASNHLNGDKKVVLLCDLYSGSCSELSATMVGLFPHGTVIGERTWGATCPLMPGQFNVLYSGVFGDYDRYGYYVYTSNIYIVDKQYNSMEGIGYVPDIECKFDYNALAEGHDNQLERALQYIRTGK